MTSLEPLKEIVVARDMQYTTGSVPVDDRFVVLVELRERFSRRLMIDERSGVSGPMMPLTMKLRRTPRYAHSSRIPSERYLACCTDDQNTSNRGSVRNSSRR